VPPRLILTEPTLLGRAIKPTSVSFPLKGAVLDDTYQTDFLKIPSMLVLKSEMARRYLMSSISR
jgi:hypothetical protein